MWVPTDLTSQIYKLESMTMNEGELCFLFLHLRPICYTLRVETFTVTSIFWKIKTSILWHLRRIRAVITRPLLLHIVWCLGFAAIIIFHFMSFLFGKRLIIIWYVFDSIYCISVHLPLSPDLTSLVCLQVWAYVSLEVLGPYLIWFCHSLVLETTSLLFRCKSLSGKMFTLQKR